MRIGLRSIFLLYLNSFKVCFKSHHFIYQITKLQPPLPMPIPTPQENSVIVPTLTFLSKRSLSLSVTSVASIDPCLTLKTSPTISTSIVHSKLDYCNSLFLNLDSTQIQH